MDSDKIDDNYVVRIKRHISEMFTSYAGTLSLIICFVTVFIESASIGDNEVLHVDRKYAVDPMKVMLSMNFDHRPLMEKADVYIFQDTAFYFVGAILNDSNIFIENNSLTVDVTKQEVINNSLIVDILIQGMIFIDNSKIGNGMSVTKVLNAGFMEDSTLRDFEANAFSDGTPKALVEGNDGSSVNNARSGLLETLAVCIVSALILVPAATFVLVAIQYIFNRQEDENDDVNDHSLDIDADDSSLEDDASSFDPSHSINNQAENQVIDPHRLNISFHNPTSC